MWAPMGKLVPQLLEVVTFAFDLRFRCVIARWKGIFNNYTWCHQTLTMSIVWLWQAKKTLFRAPKRPWKYIKMHWHEKFQSKPVGIGGIHQYPPGCCVGLQDNPWSVEPTITKKYKRLCWNKNCQEEPVAIGGWPPISTWINYVVRECGI